MGVHRLVRCDAQGGSERNGKRLKGLSSTDLFHSPAAMISVFHAIAVSYGGRSLGTWNERSIPWPERRQSSLFQIAFNALTQILCQRTTPERRNGFTSIRKRYSWVSSQLKFNRVYSSCIPCWIKRRGYLLFKREWTELTGCVLIIRLVYNRKRRTWMDFFVLSPRAFSSL